MSKLMKVTVEKSDGSISVYPILPKTHVAFERHFSMGLGAIGQAGRTEHLYWLAWDAERTAGKIVKPFDAWLDEVVSVDSEDEPVPFDQPLPSPT